MKAHARTLDPATFIELKRCLETPAPTQTEFEFVCGIFEEYVEIPIAAPETFYAQLRENLQKMIDEFGPYAFSADFGLEKYHLSDLLTFLLDTTQFAFSLKKRKGLGILYAFSHVMLRRNWINTLPDPLLPNILIPKLERFCILNKIQSIIKSPEPLHYNRVEDIGMGHSVYLTTITSRQGQAQSFVVKQESLPNQEFYTNLLTMLKWPTFISRHFVDSATGCGIEISTYLGNKSLKEAYNSESDFPNWLETELAQHAALGGAFGRGDRHFENYMITNNHLFPVDISFLFSSDNETWDSKYIAAGTYEFNFLYRFWNTPALFKQKLSQFFDTYANTLHTLASHKAMLKEAIFTYYKNHDPAQKFAFLDDRLSNIESYTATQKKNHINAFCNMLVRRYDKQLLQKLYKTVPEIVSQNPILKMYALADSDKPSALFLVEDHTTPVIETIRELAVIHLMKKSQLIADLETLHTQRQTLKTLI